MKKILKFIVVIAALITTVCSVTNKASAEETVSEPTTTSDVQDDNLFTGYEVNFVWDSSFNHSFNNENPNFTNLIPQKEERQLLLSFKFNVENLDINSNSTLDLNGIATFFTSDYQMTYQMGLKALCTISWNFENEYAICTAIFDASALEYYKTYRYVSFGNIMFAGFKNGGGVVNVTSDNLEDVYIAHVVQDSIDASELNSLEFDYTLMDPKIKWNHDAKYLELNVNETIFKNPSAIFTAEDKDGNKLSISYGDIGRFKMPGEVGTYYYIYEAKDQYGNRDYKYVKFNVIDDIAPTVSGPTILRVPNKILTSITAIKNSLIVSDNQDSTEDINIVLKYDYYSDNYDVPGEYYICFTAEDKAGNSADFIIKMIVEDKDAPYFYDSNGIAKSKTTVLKSMDSVLLLSDITSRLKVLDNVDGELKISVHKDEYTGNGDKVGTYSVILKAIDKSGNVAYHSVLITVVDTMPSKSIFLDDKIVIIEKNVKLKATDFHAILQLSGKYNVDTTSYTKVQNYIYEPSYNIPGEYLVPYEITTTSGIEESDTLIVQVVESRTNGSFIDHPEQAEKDGVIVSILKWIWSLFVGLYNWFVGLFK